MILFAIYIFVVTFSFLLVMLNLQHILFLGLPPDVNQVHQPLLVCTAHIHWDPEFCDVKLIQVMMLCGALKGVLDEASLHFRPNPSPTPVQLLLCGDFNSLPDSGKISVCLLINLKKYF